MSRTIIDLDDALVQVVMVRYQLKSKREAVDLGGPQVSSNVDDSR